MTTTIYGSKYAATKDLSKAQIAALIRAEIKAAVKAGELPRAKYSVRTDHYAGGSSIDVRISGLPFGVLNAAAHTLVGDRVEYNFDAPGRPSRFTAESVAVEEKVTAIVAAYNFDGSDTQSDYFHVRFHSDVTIDDAGAYEQLRAELAADRASEQRNADERLEMLGDELADLDSALPAPAVCVAASGWL